MKASHLLASLAAAISLAQAQNATTVTTQIQVITNYTQLLNSDVLNNNGSIQGLPWALQVQLDAVNIYRQIQNGTAQANASASFGDAGSQTVAAALLNTTSVVQTALNSTQSKVSAFGELGPLVLGSLYQLKQATDTFSEVLVPKLSVVYQMASPVIVAELDTAFNNAIVAYGGNGTWSFFTIHDVLLTRSISQHLRQE